MDQQHPADAVLSFERHLIGVKNYPEAMSFKEFLFSDGSSAKFDSEKFDDSKYTTEMIEPENAVVKLVRLRYVTDGKLLAMEFFDQSKTSILRVGYYGQGADP